MGRATYGEVVAKREEVTALWGEVLAARRRAVVAQRELDAMLLEYDPGGLVEGGGGGD